MELTIGNNYIYRGRIVKLLKLGVKDRNFAQVQCLETHARIGVDKRGLKEVEGE